jgi:hypothetical protein
MVSRKSEMKLLEEDTIKCRAADVGLQVLILDDLSEGSIQVMTDLFKRKQLVRKRQSPLPKKACPASGMKSNPKRVNRRSVFHANGSGQKADDGSVRLVAGISWSLKFYGIP